MNNLASKDHVLIFPHYLQLLAELLVCVELSFSKVRSHINVRASPTTIVLVVLPHMEYSFTDLERLELYTQKPWTFVILSKPLCMFNIFRNK